MAKGLKGFQKGNKNGIYPRTETMKMKLRENGKKSYFQKGHKTNLGKHWKMKDTSKMKGRKRLPFSKDTRRKMSEAKKGEKNHFWKGGISYKPYSTDWTETLRRSIRERDNYICQLCSQYGQFVHHIDYQKQNCNPDNLITLCRNCHFKTNINRDYWTNYFKI